VNIRLITPAPLRFNNGNKITAVRWGAMLRSLGHRVSVGQKYDGSPCDLLIALHARRSYESIERFYQEHPELPLIVVLTGTDLYRDIRVDSNAQRSLDLATRLVVLQKQALAELPKSLHAKTRVIYQSAAPCNGARPRANRGDFTVSVIGHLRQEKDPLRAALAARLLPASSRIRLVHLGRALDKPLEKRARLEMARNPRYRWLGELAHWKARQILARSHLTVITSRMEGSSNVLCEALASSVPVLATKIAGLIGTLGRDYPGFFPVGDTEKLAALLTKAESDKKFYALLKHTCKALAPIVAPRREIKSWKTLLSEFEQ
jgi:putative glycosyltransferase (TIGR04348 family)